MNYPSLPRFRACRWSTVSLPRQRLAAVEREAAAAHPAAALVTSCQRLEAYTAEPCACAAPARSQGFEALVHLAEVAAGLHSVVLGERQVLGQVRAALPPAPAPVRELGSVAVAAARALRAETAFDSHAGHLLDRALRFSGVPAQGRLLVLGPGTTGRLVAERGLALGFEEVLLAGRSRPAALPQGARWLPLDGRLPAADVLVGCLGSGAPEMDAAALPPVAGLLLDLGTPRNFGGVSACPSLTIADLLAAEEYERPHATRRRGDLRARVRVLVEERLEQAGDASAPVRALWQAAEQARRIEVERMRRLHPELDEAAVDVFSRALVNRLLDLPTRRLRAADPALAERVAAVFMQ